MNFQEMKARMLEKSLDVFSTREFSRLFGLSESEAAVKLTRYKNQGYLKSPKRGIYYFGDSRPDKFRLANFIYRPSYVSMDTILSKEGIIPETVYTTTSVTTKATREYDDGETVYTYSKIKRGAYGGYRLEGGVLAALPEKALVDYLYFVAQGKRELNDRLNLARLDKLKMLDLAKLYDDKRLNNLLKKVLK